MRLPQPRHVPAGIALACLFGIMLTPLVVWPPEIYPFITGKALWFRALTLLAVICWCIAMAVGERRLPPLRLSLGLAAIGALAAVSDATAIDPKLAFFGEVSRQEGFVGMAYWITFVLILAAVCPPADLRRLLALSVLVSCIVAVLAVGHALVVWPSHLAGSTLGNPSYVGIYCAMHVFLAMRLTEARPVWVAAALVNATAVIAAQSRGGILALGIGYGFCVWPDLNRTARMVMVAVAALAAGTMLALNLHNERLAVWAVSIGIWLERPWLGWGHEGFRALWLAVDPGLTPSMAHGYDRAHNWLLDRLVALGVAGTAVWLWLLAETARRGRDGMLRGALAAYLVGTFFLFDVLAVQIALALVVALAWSEGRDVALDAARVTHGQPFLNGLMRAGRSDPR